MVPIAPMGIYGVVASISNGMVPLAYLIGMVAMIFTALSYARIPDTIYEHVDRRCTGNPHRQHHEPGYAFIARQL